MKIIFGINTALPRPIKVVLAILPFLLAVIFYLGTSYKRHIENPKDKVAPNIRQLADGLAWATKADRGERRLPIIEPIVKQITRLPIIGSRIDTITQTRLGRDTLASMTRFIIGVFLSAFVGILLGLHIGVFPFFESLFLKFVTFFDKIPALALLPILIIAVGLGETAKIMLIFIGISPTIALDTYLRAKEIPREQFVKALSLGASDWEVAYKVVLPQIFPKALDCVRLNLKAAWLFLIAGEALAATVGLGYRIFVVRRYLAMNIIIPYVLWIGIVAFAADFLLGWWVKRRYRWLYQ